MLPTIELEQDLEIVQRTPPARQIPDLRDHAKPIVDTRVSTQTDEVPREVTPDASLGEVIRNAFESAYQEALRSKPLELSAQTLVSLDSALAGWIRTEDDRIAELKRLIAEIQQKG